MANIKQLEDESSFTDSRHAQRSLWTQTAEKRLYCVHDRN